VQTMKNGALVRDEGMEQLGNGEFLGLLGGKYGSSSRVTRVAEIYLVWLDREQSIM